MSPLLVSSRVGCEIRLIGSLMGSGMQVLVPVVYEIVDNIEKWLAPKFKRFITPREAEERREERDQLFGYPPGTEPPTYGHGEPSTQPGE